MTTMLDKDEKLKFAGMLSDLRNGLQQVVTSIDGFLSYIGENETGGWNPENIKWIPAEGPSGAYEKAVEQEGRDFALLTKDLIEHGETMTVGGLFYWKFGDSSTIGRKP